MAQRKKPAGSGRRQTESSDLIDQSRKGKPEKPAWLDEIASWFWDQTVPELVRLGIAKRIDGPVLTMMAAWYSRWAKLIQVDRSAITDVQRATKEFNLLAKRFGLTPADRLAMRSGAQSGQAVIDDNGSADEDESDPLTALLMDRAK